MRWVLLVSLTVLACSSRRHREQDRISTPTVLRDARVADAPPTPAWIIAALAHGGPGLCASIIDTNAYIMRRDTSGRLVETLAFDPQGQQERTEFRYDAKTGRLKQRDSRATEHGDFDKVTDFWYDAAGRVVRVRDHHAKSALYPGDLNVTYTWKGKAIAKAAGQFFHEPVEDPDEPLAPSLAFTGTVHEARFHDGSPAPQPENEYDYTYDERGRLVRKKSVGWAESWGDDRYEWDGDDRLVAIHTVTSNTKYEWRDGRVVRIRETDHDGKPSRHQDLHYDAAGRIVEWLNFSETADERVTSTSLDRDAGVLAITSVVDEPDVPRARRTYHYDCGPPATP